MSKKRTLMMSIGRVHRIWTNYVKEVALSVGIPDSYVTVILYIEKSPGANQRNIAEFAQVTTSAINQTVKNMIEEGFIRKEIDECDKRHSRLYFTEKGRETAKILHMRLHQADEAITALITSERESEMMALLDRISDYIWRDLSLK